MHTYARICTHRQTYFLYQVAMFGRYANAHGKNQHTRIRAVSLCVCVCAHDASVLASNEVTRCWAHEIQRVFGDRLTAGRLEFYVDARVSYAVPTGQSLIPVGLGSWSSDEVGFGLEGFFAARRVDAGLRVWSSGFGDAGSFGAYGVCGGRVR